MASCEHPGGERFRVCSHLRVQPDGLEVLERFTGRGIEREYVCRACVDARELDDVCAACRDEAADSFDGIVGSPGIVEEDSDLAFVHRRVALALPAFTDVQPVLGERSQWLGVTADGELHHFDLDRGTTRLVMRVQPDAPIERPMLRVSRDGTFAAVVDRRGTIGVVVALDGTTRVPLAREDYHSAHCTFPIAFFERGGRTLFVWAPEWNRVDVADPRTGEVLTPRTSPAHREAHYLDYFHCGLSVSPDQRYIVDNGWVWHPFGIVVAWSLERWLADNVWEAEDGPSLQQLCARSYYWDGPLAWLDATRIGIYGHGTDVERLIPALLIVDVTTGEEERWFAGPRGELACSDRDLYATADDGTTVWNVARGSRLHRDPRLVHAHYHPTARTFLALGDGVVLAVPRGHDARAPWNRGHVTDLAQRIARERSFEDLPVLGDALEAAGCDDVAMLAHCQHAGAHGDRCWVVDRLVR